jgi:tRNA pseudouridine55 synthase
MARMRKRKGEPISGWLNFDKPREMTSTQAVTVVKRLLNAEKAGHGGTLDPLATGILPIAFGEATKTVPWTMDAEKEYVFTIRWGISTASVDAEGTETAWSDVRPEKAAIAAALATFSGTILQVPPKFSAIKVDGQRAYDLAREGTEFELEGREVVVHDARLVGVPDADHAVIHVRTGKGFYVRALARDMAQMLGAEGHISALRRTRVGVFADGPSVTLDALQALHDDPAALRAALMPLQCVLTRVPVLRITGIDVGQLRQGREIVLLPHVMDAWQAARAADEEDRLALAECDGTAIALGEVRAGRFEPGRVFQY